MASDDTDPAKPVGKPKKEKVIAALEKARASRASKQEKVGQARASSLSEKLKLAAHLIGKGLTVLKACEEAGCDPTYVSKLRHGVSKPAKEFQAIAAKSLNTAMDSIRQTALARLQQVMETGTDKDAVAAAREAEAMVRNMVTAEAERSKIRIERERLAIQKDQAASGQQQTLGIVMLPQKSDAPWLPAANPVMTPITIPLDHS